MRARGHSHIRCKTGTSQAGRNWQCLAARRNTGINFDAIIIQALGSSTALRGKVEPERESRMQSVCQAEWHLPFANSKQAALSGPDTSVVLTLATVTVALAPFQLPNLPDQAG
jgi:hypothetical protein